MEDFIARLIEAINIGNALVVLSATEIVRYAMNVIWRKTYTDFWSPLVALVMGQIMAYRMGGVYGIDVAIAGLQLAGSAMVFSSLWKKFNEGVAWFSGKKDDPVIMAKLEKTNAKVEQQIAAVKKAVGNGSTKDGEDENP